MRAFLIFVIVVGLGFVFAPETERRAAGSSQTDHNAVGCSEAHARGVNAGAPRPGVTIQLDEALTRPRPGRHRTIPRPNAGEPEAVSVKRRIRSGSLDR